MIVVVNKLDNEDDDDPLPFNPRRALSGPDDISQNFRRSTSLGQVASIPRRKISFHVPVEYETKSGRVVSLALSQSPVQSSDVSPMKGNDFSGRRQRLNQVAARLDGIFDDIRPLRNSESPRAGVSSRRGLRHSNSSESGSLDGFIVIDDSDSDADPSVKPRKKQESWADFLTDNPETELSNASRSPTKSRDRLKPDSRSFADILTLLGKVEDKNDHETLYPPRLQPGYTIQPGLQSHTESDALRLAIPSFYQSRRYDELFLSDFTIYRQPQFSGRGFGGQLESLYLLSVYPSQSSRKKKIDLMIDGSITHDNQTYHFEAAEIESIVINGLDDPSSSSTTILIRTLVSNAKHVQYCLATSQPLYETHFQSFVWIADLAKHVLRFMADASERQRDINLESFAESFYDFIQNLQLSSLSEEIGKWHQECDHVLDFRRHIIRYGGFLYSHACEVSDPRNSIYPDLLEHSLWRKIGQEKTNDPKLDLRNELTSVTRFIGDTFLQTFPSWGPAGFNLLETVVMIETVVRARRKRCDDLQLSCREEVDGDSKADSALQAAVQAGRFPVRFSPQQVLNTAIIVKHQGQHRYAFVKGIVEGTSSVTVIWLCRPKETICGSADDGTFYPVGNELFFSDECCCGRVRASSILASFEIQVFAHQGRTTESFFVRQLYECEAQVFRTLDRPKIWQNCMACKPTPLSPEGVKHGGNCDSMPKLRALSLFSGCGLLDYGLESTGPFETTVAIEIDQTAILSHKANQSRGSNTSCTYYPSSTNACLVDIAQGSKEYNRFNCVVAGCPCQGFSLRNQNRESKNAHRNCSMLANTLSYVDLFRPEYVLIENVTNMDRRQPGSANACAQAICCLVAMGYQVRKIVLSGGDFGGATKRTRLFIVAASSGMKLPEEPSVEQAVAFRNTAFDAIHDLDAIPNDTVVNIKMPDHVPYERFPNDFDAKISLRGIVKRVPTTGPKRNLFGAFDNGLLTARQTKWFKNLTQEKQNRGSNALQRVNPEGLFPTITRYMVPLDSRGGDSLHPFQHRVVTVEELRKAQGLPDDFLLIGSTQDTTSQIGNGVVWQVAQALGKTFGQAWAASQAEVSEDDTDHGRPSATWEQRASPVKVSMPAKVADITPLMSQTRITPWSDRKGPWIPKLQQTTIRDSNPSTPPPFMKSRTPKFRDSSDPVTPLPVFSKNRHSSGKKVTQSSDSKDTPTRLSQTHRLGSLGNTTTPTHTSTRVVDLRSPTFPQRTSTPRTQIAISNDGGGDSDDEIMFMGLQTISSSRPRKRLKR